MDDRAGRASEAATAATWMPEAGRLGSGDRGDVDDRGRAPRKRRPQDADSFASDLAAALANITL